MNPSHHSTGSFPLDSVGRRRFATAARTQKIEITGEFDTIVDGHTVVHEFELDGDEVLHVGDHVALVNDGVSIVAVVTAIDEEGYRHLALR